MKIDATYIRKFNPCNSGIVNFEKHYPNYTGTIQDILALDKVPYSDKIWLATKVCPIKVLQLWSVSCAESVLPNYEKQYPNDSRIKDCLETTRQFILGKSTLENLSAAWSAAWSAAESAAWSARSAAWSAAESASSAESAESAESAAESAAWSARSAARSAAWSAARSAAWSAARSAAEKEQEDLNITLLISTILEYNE